MAERPGVVLRSERTRSVRLGHPWVMSGSVERLEGDPGTGDVVRVLDARGSLLALGDYDADSQIRVRVFDFAASDEDPDEKWLRTRLEDALAWRASHPALRGTDALRLVHAEADGLPGLIVDRYAGCLAVKLQTPGMLRRAEKIARTLQELTDCAGAWLRGPEAGVDRGLFGSVPDEVEIVEHGRRYAVDLKHGQKTGFYLDQRDARSLFGSLAAGARALDLFSYTGGFAAAALDGGARETVAVETSRRALDLLERNAPGAEAVQAEAAAFLRDDARSFDLIALDPPALAKRKRDTRSATRAYKDLNLHALRRAAPGAHLLTFSCSHHMDAVLFRKVVFGAALDAGRQVQVLATLGAPVDHPVSIRHPQGEYLKGLLLRVGGDA